MARGGRPSTVSCCQLGSTRSHKHEGWSLLVRLREHRTQTRSRPPQAQKLQECSERCGDGLTRC